MGEITRDELDRALREDIVYNSDKVASSADVTVHGRTLVNLLGRAGNAIYGEVNHVANGELTYENDTFVLRSTETSIHSWLVLTGKQEAEKYYIALMDANTDTIGDHVQIHGSLIIPGSTKMNSSSKVGVWQTIFASAKVETTGQLVVNPACGVGSITKYKNIRAYEITKEEYDEILNMTPQELGQKYPYVDSAQCVVNPYLEVKENLLQGVQVCRKKTYSLPDNEYFGQVCSSNESRAAMVRSIELADGKYTLSVENFSVDKLEIRASMCNIATREFIDVTGAWCAAPDKHFTFEVTNGFNVLNIAFRKGENELMDDAELYNVENIKLVLVKGSEPKKYKDCNNSRIAFETKLYDGETITRENDGTYVKKSIWDEYSKMHELNYSVFEAKSGYKVIQSTIGTLLPDSINLDKDAHVVSYRGEIIPKYNSQTYPEGCIWTVQAESAVDSERLLRASFPNALTGWGDDYIPTKEEIRAFLLGWRMYESVAEIGVDANPKSALYNGNGIKCWRKIYSGVGDYNAGQTTGIPWEDLGIKVIVGSAVGTCPTTLNDQGYAPYKIIYQKEVSTLEKVKTYGSLLVKEDTDVICGSGLILGDKSKVIFNNVNYVINAYDDALSKLKERVERFDKVYDSDGNIVKFGETIRTSAEGMRIAGKAYATMGAEYFDRQLLVDYLIYGADTVTSFDYSLDRAKNMKQLISRSHQDTVNCFGELARTKKELQRAKEELARRSNANLLINGDAQICQRGESITTTKTQYTLDRWCSWHPGFTVSKVANTSEANCPNAIRIIYNNADTSKLYFYQPLENLDFLQGKVVTSSFYIRGINGFGGRFGFRVGSTGGLGIDVTSEWKKVVYTQKLDFSAATQLYDKSFFFYSINANPFSENQGIEITGMKMEFGDVATPFVPRTYTEELNDCRRFYQGAELAIYGGVSIPDERIGVGTHLPIVMRTTPSVVGQGSSGAAVDLSTISIGVTPYKVDVSVLANAQSVMCRLTVQILLDAELY